MAQRYKSNVKLANFYGAGIPCLVGADEVAYRETDNGEVRFFATPQELVERLDELRPHATRLRIHRSFLAIRGEYSLAAIADRYEAYLRRLAAQRVA
jgi:glycosyltransferase involved in cell wall biosynthesis